jgi:hypothetical protein
MPSSRTESEPLARSVRFTQRELVVTLRDGRKVCTPLDWYPRLLQGKPAQRRKWELIGDGVGIHWPALDEDLSVEGMLRGIPAVGSKARARSSARPRRRSPRRR